MNEETFISIEDKEGICAHCGGIKRFIFSQKANKRYWRWYNCRPDCKHKWLKQDTPPTKVIP